MSDGITPTLPTWGTRLRWFRETQRCETREELAAAIGCDARLLARWERGEVRCPRPSYRRRLAELDAPLPPAAMPAPWQQGPSELSLGEGAGRDVDAAPTRREHRSGGDDPTRRRDLLKTATLAGAAPLLPSPTHESGESRRVLRALDVMHHSGAGAIVEGLSELIDYYALATCTMPPAAAHDELLAIRAHIDGILEQKNVLPRYKDIIAASGWFSNLLAVAACDMGEHAAARLWCADAQRHGREVRLPELTAWAMLTRSMIAFYQGQPRHSADLSARGQRITHAGTVVHAKLAAQEMRAAALIGDTDRMVGARSHATEAIATLPPRAGEQSGVFSIPLGHDPPYTATSLLLLGRFNEAVTATNQVIQTVYKPEARQRGDHPSGYARSLLILALAEAGSGDLDAAVSAGNTALEGNRPAWPTLVLAGKLDRVLTRGFTGAAETGKYHTRYLEVAGTVVGNISGSHVSLKDRV